MGRRQRQHEVIGVKGKHGVAKGAFLLWARRLHSQAWAGCDGSTAGKPAVPRTMHGATGTFRADLRCILCNAQKLLDTGLAFPRIAIVAAHQSE
jgi:hypothetical protein